MDEPNGLVLLNGWREDTGTSQAKLAEALDLSQPAIALWGKNGARPPLAKALELQAHTGGAVPATSWGYTEEQVAKVLRAAGYPATTAAAPDTTRAEVT